MIFASMAVGWYSRTGAPVGQGLMKKAPGTACLVPAASVVVTMFAQAKSPLPGTTGFDVIIKNGMVYDGTGAEPRRVDVAIRGDRIAGVGDFKTAKAKTVVDANGLGVAPGFINMLSWSTVSLIQDGRSLEDILDDEDGNSWHGGEQVEQLIGLPTCTLAYASRKADSGFYAAKTAYYRAVLGALHTLNAALGQVEGQR